MHVHVYIYVRVCGSQRPVRGEARLLEQTFNGTAERIDAHLRSFWYARMCGLRNVCVRVCACACRRARACARVSKNSTILFFLALTSFSSRSRGAADGRALARVGFAFSQRERV